MARAWNQAIYFLLVFCGIILLPSEKKHLPPRPLKRRVMCSMSPSLKRVSRNFLKSATTFEKTSSSPAQYLVEREERTFLLERHGTCEYERCKAICCRMLCLNLQWNEYLAGFAEMGIHAPLIYRTCRHLAQDWTCLRWNSQHFPHACANFPVPGDAMYLEVMDVCSFFFVFLREVKLDNPMDHLTE